MPNIFSMRFALSVLAGGVILNAIATGKLDTANGKFLGLVDQNPNDDKLGLDDFAKAGVIIAGAKMAANFLGPKLG